MIRRLSDGIWSVRHPLFLCHPEVFAANGLEAPTDWDEFFTAADALKEAGVTPLAVGDNGIWATTHLFESILLSQLGPAGYRGLWTGETAWDDGGVRASLEILSRLFTDYVNEDHAALSWDQAAQLVADGDAAMTIMGDWPPATSPPSAWRRVKATAMRRPPAPADVHHCCPTPSACAGRPHREARWAVADPGRLARGPGRLQPAEGLDPRPH